MDWSIQDVSLPIYVWLPSPRLYVPENICRFLQARNLSSSMIWYRLWWWRFGFFLEIGIHGWCWWKWENLRRNLDFNNCAKRGRTFSRQGLPHSCLSGLVATRSALQGDFEWHRTGCIVTPLMLITIGSIQLYLDGLRFKSLQLRWHFWTVEWNLEP